jgi:signal transduction histidine kinase
MMQLIFLFIKSKKATINYSIIVIVSAIITIAIFIIDINTPLGINEGYFYTVTVLLTLWIPGKSSTYITSIIGIILTILGFHLSAAGIAVEIAAVNRLLAVIGIGITAFTILKYKEKERIVKKQNEELEQLVVDLKRSNSELEQYAYVASHDLQEPLRNITNYVNLLGERISNDIDGETAYYLNIIINSAEKMRSLIQNILLYSLIGKDRTTIKIDCNKVLNEVLIDMRFSIRKNQARIRAGTLPVIEGNRSEIKQLFQNLISNAIKYKKKGVAPEIYIHCEDKNTEWEFSFTDNGIGIEEKYFNKLFKVFQRLHSEHDYPGAGIGLAICKKIVSLYGGKIWVSSKAGKGSTFYFTIPKHQN